MPVTNINARFNMDNLRKRGYLLSFLSGMSAYLYLQHFIIVSARGAHLYEEKKTHFFRQGKICKPTRKENYCLKEFLRNLAR